MNTILIAACLGFIAAAVLWNIIPQFREWVRDKIGSTVIVETVGAAIFTATGALVSVTQEVQAHLPDWAADNMWVLLVAYGIFARLKTTSAVR